MSPIRSALLLLVSLVFVAGGAYILWRAEAGDRALGASCLVFFGACALVFVGELLPKHAPAPDAAGVTLIRPDRAQMAILTVAAAGMAGACPVIGGLAAADGQIVKSWIVWSGVAFFGLGAVIGLWRLVRARPLLRLDAHGIANLAGAGWTLPWSAIRGIEGIGAKGQNFLGFDVDPAAGVKGGPMQSVNRAFGFPAFTLGAQGTGMRFDQFATLVGAYWTRHRGW